MSTIWQRMWSRSARQEARQNRREDKGKIQGDRSGFPEWLQKYSGLGLDENGQISSKAIGNGAGFSNTQLAQMQYNHDEAQLDRQWQEDMYNKYQSPEAQMRQYQQAGLNPALMYQGGVDINGPSGGSAASESGAQGGEDPQNGFERAMGVMGQIMQMLTGGANLATQIKSVNMESKAKNFENALTQAQTHKTEEETNGIVIENQRKQLAYSLELAVKGSVITEKEATAAKAAWEADVLKHIDPLEAAQNILTKYHIDLATLDKTTAETAKLGAEKGKLDAETALANGRNTREAAKNNAEIELIQHQIAEIDSEKSFNDISTKVQQEVRKSSAAKAFLDDYAKENNLPLGDYTAISIFRHYHLWYTKTQDSKYLTMMNEIRDMLYKNMGKDTKITWKDFGGYLSSAVNVGIKAAAK